MSQEKTKDYEDFSGFVYRALHNYTEYMHNKLTDERVENIQHIKSLINKHEEVGQYRKDIKIYIANLKVGINLYFFRTPGGSTLRCYVNAGIGHYDNLERLATECKEGTNLKDYGRLEGKLKNTKQSAQIINIKSTTETTESSSSVTGSRLGLSSKDYSLHSVKTKNAIATAKGKRGLGDSPSNPINIPETTGSINNEISDSVQPIMFGMS